LPTKLIAFAISSFYCGVAGAMLVFFWYGSAEPDVFDINRSFDILFMVIIGGLGSLMGSYLGAAFIWSLPILMRIIPEYFGFTVEGATIEHISFMMIGGLIIFFLIVEPNGFARLWQIAKEKLRRWPFPY
jgi:branched-chain amino acid transport system permease protein